MNRYTVNVRKEGSFEPISGRVVYPFTTSNLLDERLDEAYVTIINSEVPLFCPMTEIQILLEDNTGTIKEYNMVVANDTSQKVIRTGLYNHTLFLVERTKILSGIVCPSLTFTNDLFRDIPTYFLPESADTRWTPAGSTHEIPPYVMSAVSTAQSRLLIYGGPDYPGPLKNEPFDYTDGARYLNYGICLPYEAYTNDSNFAGGAPADYYNTALIENDVADGVTQSQINSVGGDANARKLWPKAFKDNVAAIPRFMTIANAMYHFNEAKKTTTDGTFKGHYIRVDWSYINVSINGRLYAVLVDAFNPATTDYQGNAFAITTTPDISTSNYIAPSRFGNEEDPEKYGEPPFDYMGEWETDYYIDGVKLTRETYQTPVFTIPPEAVFNNDIVTFEYVLMYLNSTGTAGGKEPSNKYTFTYSLTVLKPDKVHNKEYDINECIDRVLKLAEPLKKGGTQRFSLNAEQAEELSKKAAPEFSMTQNTLREQLKLIGSYIHAEPRLDKNDVIYYDDYTPGKRANINGKLIEDVAQWDVNNYATVLKSNVQNLVSTNGYASAKAYQQGKGVLRSVRAENAYARLEDNNVIIDTMFPIYGIEAVKCRFDYGAYSNITWDITSFVYESAQYNLLKVWTTAYTDSKAFAVYYTLGERNIKGIAFNGKELTEQALNQKYAISNIISTIAGYSPNAAKELNDAIQENFTKLQFEVVYRPIYPSFISHGKGIYNADDPRYAKVYNQSENFIESRAYGENMKGTAERTGNPDVIKTLLLSSLNDIPKPGYIYDDMVIASVDVEVFALSIKCTLGLTREFNRISQYIGVPSNKRMYQISERQVSNRDILIHNTIIASDGTKEYVQNENAPTLIKNISFWQSIAKSFDNRVFVDPISCAVVECSSEEEDGIHRLTDVLLPVIPSSFGNSITFYFSYEDNYSAGTEALTPTLASSTIGGVWSSAVQYPNNKGNAQYLTYYLVNDTSNVNEWGTPASLPRLNPSFTPDVAESSSAVYLNDDGALLLLKDNREKISVTTEFEFQSDIDGLVIGSAMATMNGLTNTALNELYTYAESNYNAILWAITDPDAVPSKFETRLAPEALTAPDSKFHSVGSGNWVVTYDTNGCVVNNTYTTNEKIYGWVVTTPSDTVTKVVRDVWTNEDSEITEERGYQILMLYAKEIDGRESPKKLFPENGIAFKIINE